MTVEIERRGLMLVLSSPSGAGKTTLSRWLLESQNNVAMSVSATTRPMRPNEVEGRDYFFKTEAEFRAMAERGDFLEHAVVFGHQYGTPKAPVFEALRRGRDVLFDIDWQGTQQLCEKARDDVVSIFVLPPSRGELERRLMARAEDPPDVIARRMAKADGEISHWAEYDYVIVNDDIVRAQAQVDIILEAERLKRTRQPGIFDFVEKLMHGR
ncbi:MAG TPA: guanylate kinase [Rhizomicrobium sp.]|nr:guanylate kinase [Rhizomicrobium sp.]